MEITNSIVGDMVYIYILPPGKRRDKDGRSVTVEDETVDIVMDFTMDNKLSGVEILAASKYDLGYLRNLEKRLEKVSDVQSIYLLPKDDRGNLHELVVKDNPHYRLFFTDDHRLAEIRISSASENLDFEYLNTIEYKKINKSINVH